MSVPAKEAETVLRKIEKYALPLPSLQPHMLSIIEKIKRR